MIYRTIKKISLLFSVLIGISTGTANSVHAQSPQETLNQYVAALQANPNDTAQREKIIKHVQTMSPPPAIPPAVDELVGQAKYVFKHAKEQKDYLDAVEAYHKVVNLAPWVGEYYYNLGLAQEQAGQLGEALKNYNLYLVSSPDEGGAKEARERIGGVKYAMSKEVRGDEPSYAAENKQREEADWLRSLDGAIYKSCSEYDRRECAFLRIQGTNVLYSTNYSSDGPFPVSDRRFDAWSTHCFTKPGGRAVCQFTPDGSRITCIFCEGENPPMIFKKE